MSSFSRSGVAPSSNRSNPRPLAISNGGDEDVILLLMLLVILSPPTMIDLDTDLVVGAMNACDDSDWKVNPSSVRWYRAKPIFMVFWDELNVWWLREVDKLTKPVSP
eukprot:scaffold364_cov224-Alexandrium_tamarense.AAC.1